MIREHMRDQGLVTTHPVVQQEREAETEDRPTDRQTDRGGYLPRGVKSRAGLILCTITC